MTDTSDIKAAGTGLVGGAIGSALLDILIEKNVITLADARTILDRAALAISAHVGTPAGSPNHCNLEDRTFLGRQP
jgi:hypothetical protein